MQGMDKLVLAVRQQFPEGIPFRWVETVDPAGKAVIVADPWDIIWNAVSSNDYDVALIVNHFKTLFPHLLTN
jgi:hypothetical protein